MNPAGTYLEMHFFFHSYYTDADGNDYFIDKTGGLINDFTGARPTNPLIFTITQDEDAEEQMNGAVEIPLIIKYT